MILTFSLWEQNYYKCNETKVHTYVLRLKRKKKNDNCRTFMKSLCILKLLAFCVNWREFREGIKALLLIFLLDHNRNTFAASQNPKAKKQKACQVQVGRYTYVDMQVLQEIVSNTMEKGQVRRDKRHLTDKIGCAPLTSEHE